MSGKNISNMAFAKETVMIHYINVQKNVDRQDVIVRVGMFDIIKHVFQSKNVQVGMPIR